jgi:pimeloyl-ACP methyl ester carboxylesterase
VEQARRSRLPFALKLAGAAILAFAALSLMMNFSQTEMLFPTHAVPRAGPLPPGAEELELRTADGERLHGVRIPGSAASTEPRTLILGFGGNAWNGQDVAEYLHQSFPEAEVVAFHYRGYAPSTGRPSARVLIDDAPLVHDLAVERVKPERVVAVGFSIGSGVAASLARRRKLDGLILVTPFDSLKAVAGDLFPWLPIGAFFQHEMATSDELRDNQVPVAILAGGRDDIVLPARTAALRREVPNLVFDRRFAEAGHNDIYHRSDFEGGLRQALQAVVAGKK